MVIENDPSGRFRIISVGQLLHPAKCCVCGNGTCEAGYVDFGLSYDYEGCVYFCVLCATEMGEVVGLYTPEEIKVTQNIADKLAVENEELNKELEYARPLVSAISSLFGGTPPDLLNPSVTFASVEVSAEPAEPVSSVTEGSAGGEPVVEEPTINLGEPGASGPTQLRNLTFD